jgi:hypothetical protein
VAEATIENVLNDVLSCFNPSSPLREEGGRRGIVVSFVACPEKSAQTKCGKGRILCTPLG